MATDPVKESHWLKLSSGERLIYCPVLTPLWQDGSWGAKLLSAHSCCTERNDDCALEHHPTPIKGKDFFFHTASRAFVLLPHGVIFTQSPPDLNRHPQQPQTTAKFSSKRKLYFIQGKAN